MNTSALLSYKTPISRTVILGVVIVVGLFLLNLLVRLVAGKVFGFGFFLIILIPALALSRGGVTLNADTVVIRRGFGKKEYPLRGTSFGYGQKSGLAAIRLSLSLHTNFLCVRQAGKQDALLPLNIAQADFEALVAAMRERGAVMDAA